MPKRNVYHDCIKCYITKKNVSNANKKKKKEKQNRFLPHKMVDIPIKQSRDDSIIACHYNVTPRFEKISGKSVLHVYRGESSKKEVNYCSYSLIPFDYKVNEMKMKQHENNSHRSVLLPYLFITLLNSIPFHEKLWKLLIKLCKIVFLYLQKNSMNNI